MKVLVTYESRSGNTKRAADDIAAAAEDLGHAVAIKPLADVRGYDISLAQVVFVGSWVKGFLIVGVGPARKAMHHLTSFGSLEGKQAAVFCTYALHPRSTLDSLRKVLADRGATVLGERAFHGHGDSIEGAAEFATEVLAAAEEMSARAE